MQVNSITSCNFIVPVAGKKHMNPLIKLETQIDDNNVQFEVLSSDPAVREIDELIEKTNNEIAFLNTEKERLLSQADWFDVSIAVASGAICGVIDFVWVGEFSLERAHEWGSKKVDSFVIRVAKHQGFTGDDLKGAVTFLEKNYPIAADKATNLFGGGKQHHLRDFSHHPNWVGLSFSMLTQFTGKVYGTDVSGDFVIHDLPQDGVELIGKNFHEKILLGLVNWFFHMVSDMAGSSSSIAMGKEGTGLPGPIGSLLKEVSTLPFFHKLDEKGYREFSVWISKLFNGTLLGDRDENGNIRKAMPFDLRTEIGVVHELGRQTVPVIINECIVRGFFFIRRLANEMKYVHSISDLRRMDWKKTLPIKNPTIAKMLLISNATFVAIDLTAASISSAITSGGNLPQFLHKFVLRVNYVGVGRLAVAIGSEIKLECKKTDVEWRFEELKTRMTFLKTAKVYYSIGQSWELVSDAEQAITQLSSHITEQVRLIEADMSATSEMMERINQTSEGFIMHNSDAHKAITDLLDEV